MKRFAVQQNAVGEETSPFVSMVSDRRGSVFCPKPRRIVPLSGFDPIRPLRRQLGRQVETCCPRTGAEALDVILAKGVPHGSGVVDFGDGQVASSPPYFSGSPPRRAANPLVLDVRFGERDAAPLTPLPTLTVSVAPSSPGRKGCVRTSLGPNPAAVRIEGFDRLDGGNRRSGSCRITAVA